MKYYYYISGLPDLSLDDTNIPVSLSTLKKELQEEVTEDDFELIKLFYYKYDHKNLIRLLQKQDIELTQEGNFSKEELISCIQDVRSFGEVRINCPEYFSRFIKAYLDKTPITENLIWEDQLVSLFYEYTQQVDNEFVKRWFAFEMNLNNILAGSLSRKHGLDYRKTIIGENDISETMKASNSKDFGLRGMVDELEEVLRVTDDNNIYERERTTDMIKWKYLEENSFFNYFTIEKIIVFLLKTEILERWIPLTKEQGSTIFRKTINALISRDNLELVEK
jgi:hypothetical protein